MHIVSNVEGAPRPGPVAVRRAAGRLPRRDRERRAEGAGDGDHRRARAGRPRASTPARVGYFGFDGVARHGHHDPHRARAAGHGLRPGRRGGRLRLGAGAGARGDASNKARALMAAIERAGRTGAEALMLLMIDNYDSFTYNLVQYLGELGAELARRPERRDHGGRGRAARAGSASCVSPGPGTPQRGRHVDRRHPAVRRADPDPGGLPGSPGDRRGLRRQVVERGAGADAREDSPGSSTTGAGCSRGCRTPSRRRATTRSSSERARLPACLEVTAETRGRARHGSAPPRRSRSRACSSTPSRS